MKVKKIITNILPIILVIVGLILIIMPIASNYIIKQKVQDTDNIVQEMSKEQLQENNEKELPKDAYDFEKVQPISPSSTFLAPNKVDPSLLIGQLTIPAVKMNLSIFKGTTDYNLLAGATTMKQDDQMGKGNFTLAGHYNKNKSILFGSLMDVKNGDIIKVTDKAFIYEYKVYETKVVDDKSTYMISNEEATKRGNPIISLMTCYFSSKTGERYFVVGDFVKKYPYDKDMMNKV